MWRDSHKISGPIDTYALHCFLGECVQAVLLDHCTADAVGVYEEAAFREQPW